MSRTACFHTLGCKLNFAETGQIARGFKERSFEVVSFADGADVTVINTCTVTAEADRKCRQAIRRAIRNNPDTFVVVTGCYAQLRPEEIAGIAGVDVVLGTAEKHRVFELVSDFSRREQTQVEVSCIDVATEFGPAMSSDSRTRAFLKVQDGCDYACSFCTIPKARGPSRSQTVNACVRQAAQLAEEGFREIVLSGVNIGLFGQDAQATLPVLLRALDRVDGIERYRISSIEPNLLTEEIIDFVAGSEHFVPHFHMPLQSGDDFVLGKMRRRYRRSVYRDRVERIKTTVPDAAIGADVIVGFPHESAEHFLNSVCFIEDLPLSYLHAFTYSERSGTLVVDDPPATCVPPSERKRRNLVVRSLSRKHQRAFVESQLSTQRPVLWETIEDGRSLGYTDNYIRVRSSGLAGSVGAVETVLLANEVESTDANGRERRKAVPVC